jgi:hypothetical protein
MKTTRRALLASTVALAAAPAMAAPARPTDAWKEADAILARIKPPTIPRRDFPITRFGAKPGGEADCTSGDRRGAGGGRQRPAADAWSSRRASG